MIQRTLLLLMLVLCSLGSALAEDWPQWRGPDRMGVSKETGLLPSWPAGGPKLLWIFRDAGSGDSGLSVVGDRLYSMGGDSKKEYVYAIDLKTQKKLWSTEVGPLHPDDGFGEGPRSTPTIDGNFLYAIGGHGDLVCVETATGRKIWSQGLQTNLGGEKQRYGYSESPLVDGDQVVASPGGKKGLIVAFDKKTGTVKWRCTFPGTAVGRDSEENYSWSTYVSMIAIESGGVRQYIQICGHVFGVRASDGKLLWSFWHDTWNSPIYHNDCVYVPYVGHSFLIKLTPNGDQFKAEKIYADRGWMNRYSGVVRVGEYIYGYSSDGMGKNNYGWRCQDFKTGKTVWKKRPKGLDKQGLRDGLYNDGSVIFADGNLYCFHQSGDVLLIKATPAGYQEQGRFRLPEATQKYKQQRYCWTYPSLANGKLYLRDQDLIFCYDVRKPQGGR